ncbi:recombinase family protein [Cellulosimicrobium marinum]|uniref:recombinase family protein n=1 Tax=Cellulosimicrobium marinum TaxID=1638992 RepID=UPI001E3F91B8|nr:recombinase family protein [Cellulosimicrobium marinum]MCB7135350.1 recombinase family protein [Cellulosimicrobium marinum]
MDVVIYTRQSMDRAGDELAVTRQEDECRRFAQDREWTVAEVYTDNDVSATKGKTRPGFEAVIKDGRPVVVWHQDRLLRVTRDLERVLDARLTVHTVTAGSLDLATPTGRAVARTVTAWSTYEGEQKAERQKAALRQRAASGKHFWAHRPFGFEKDGTHREDEAQAVREAYQAVLAGKTLASIARDFNDAGLLTSGNGELGGKLWRGVRVRSFLLSARNAGLREYRQEVVGKGAWEPIVDEGTYYAAVAVLKDESRGKGGSPRRNLLTGLVKCGKCGRTMVACSTGTSPNRYKGYRCPTSHLTVRAEALERIVLGKAMRLYMSTDASFLEPEREAVDTSGLEQEAKTLRQRLDDLATAFAEGHVTLSQLTTATQALNTKLEAVQEALGAAEAPRRFGVPVSQIMANFRGEDADAKRAALAYFEVVVQPVPRGAKRDEDSVSVTLADNTTG